MELRMVLSVRRTTCFSTELEFQNDLTVTGHKGVAWRGFVVHIDLVLLVDTTEEVKYPKFYCRRGSHDLRSCSEIRNVRTSYVWRSPHLPFAPHLTCPLIFFG